MSDVLDQMKAKAEELAESDLYWVEHKEGSLFLGFDWLGECFYLIDLQHPDGLLIERSDFQLDRVFEGEVI